MIDTDAIQVRHREETTKIHPLPPLSASDLLVVACPTCGAAEGDPCNPSHPPLLAFHSARLWAATTDPTP